MSTRTVTNIKITDRKESMIKKIQSHSEGALDWVNLELSKIPKSDVGTDSNTQDPRSCRNDITESGVKRFLSTKWQPIDYKLD